MRLVERIPYHSFEKRETGREKVERYLTEVVYPGLRGNGFPVTKDCRISVEEAVAMGIVEESAYTSEEIKRDREAVEELERGWRKRGREKSEGERLEKLIIAIFHKSLGEGFFICRSSLYDDKKHPYVKYGIDNILFDKKTGNPICAFDEVADMSGPRYEEKVKKILELNEMGGGYLKYGLEIEPKKEGEQERLIIKMGKVRYIPVFYLALSPEALNKAEEEFISSSQESSAVEEALFRYFLNSIEEQIYGSKGRKGLKARELCLYPILRSRLNFFEEKLKEIKKLDLMV